MAVYGIKDNKCLQEIKDEIITVTGTTTLTSSNSAALVKSKHGVTPNNVYLASVMAKKSSDTVWAYVSNYTCYFDPMERLIISFDDLSSALEFKLIFKVV